VHPGASRGIASWVGPGGVLPKEQTGPASKMFRKTMRSFGGEFRREVSPVEDDPDLHAAHRTRRSPA
jgi:hypothetical protein